MPATRASSDLPLLTLRELNRALLARQMLLGRERTPVATAVERLGALQAQWPPAPYIALWSRLATYGGLVHAPPSGTWAYRRSGSLIAAKSWLGEEEPPSFEAAVQHSVRRHLAAFGPASLDDISSWTHIRVPPIRDAIAAMGKKVSTFRGENGALLYDLASSPRPPADTEAPVRFLPKWDSTLLAYVPADRVRILPEKLRKAVIIKNGDVAQTFLVDGVVAGTWDVAATPKVARLTLRPFGALGRPVKTALSDEGDRLARFVAPGSSTYEVRVGARP